MIEEVSVSCRALGRNVENPMIALALSQVIDSYGLRELAFLFRKGPRNLPAHMWLTVLQACEILRTEASRSSLGRQSRNTTST